MMRFHDPQTGTVQWDGVDLRRLRHDALRPQLGVVFQESVLFEATARENIRIGREGATDAEVEDAARAAEIHDVIAALPNGYETAMGATGALPSGGQLQRLAIARAL